MACRRPAIPGPCPRSAHGIGEQNFRCRNVRRVRELPDGTKHAGCGAVDDRRVPRPCQLLNGGLSAFPAIFPAAVDAGDIPGCLRPIEDERPGLHRRAEYDEGAETERGVTVRLVCWNIAKKFEPWRELVEMARRGEADVALLQEAGDPPGEVAQLVRYDGEHWNRELYDRWPLVVQLSDRIEIEWLRQVPPRSELGERDIGVSGIGTVAAARVWPRGRPEDEFLAVSMYARWIKFHPLTGHQRNVGASDVSAHRILSDLSTFIYDDAAYSRHRIVAAGDLNISYGATGRKLSMPERERTIWDRFAALGLEFVGPQAPHGRPASSPQPDVPADTGNVPTYYTPQQKTAAKAMVRARVAGELVASDPAWIDHERQLRATARGRSLADSFRARVQPGLWGADGWAEVLDAFCKHLNYMPTVRSGVPVRHPGPGDAIAEQPEFTAADVFASDYQAPKLDPVWFPASGDGGGHVQSLQQFLLRWFGTEHQEVDDEPPMGDKNPDGDEVVDRPESLPATLPPEVPPNERDRRRIARILDQIQAAMTSSEFLSERGPEYLATDLRVASALLSLGLRRGWVERKQFFDLTQGIWSSLFFSSAPRQGMGWLEVLADASEDRQAFVNTMRSEELSAALIGWYLAVSTDGEKSPAAVRFQLAAVLAVARLPWLWQGGNLDEIAKELAVLLAHTADLRLGGEEIQRRAEAEWELLMRRGQALSRLEAAVNRMTPVEIRDRIAVEQLRPGDLLWQGNSGFCVVRRGCSRFTGANATVLKLQGNTVTEFRASYTVPMSALLQEDVVPLTRDFGARPRQVLREFVRELSTASLDGRSGTERGRVWL